MFYLWYQYSYVDCVSWPKLPMTWSHEIVLRLFYLSSLLQQYSELYQQTILKKNISPHKVGWISLNSQLVYGIRAWSAHLQPTLSSSYIYCPYNFNSTSIIVNGFFFVHFLLFHSSSPTPNFVISNIAHVIPIKLKQRQRSSMEVIV